MNWTKIKYIDSVSYSCLKLWSGSESPAQNGDHAYKKKDELGKRINVQRILLCTGTDLVAGAG